jgi:ankyrin repeat protein
MLGALYGKLDVSTLVDRGASIDDVDELGVTALTAAAARGSLAIVELLHQRGANIRHSDRSGADALI